MLTKEEIYAMKFAALNERQKEAVNAIYGAVMVIAGPGTGKTETLSMRIANLLKSEAQISPNEILCLTYTDEATNSMRRRLVQIIGSEAHRVNIFTFHSFCNNVIQYNPWYFSQYTNHELQPITDLECSDILKSILDNIPPGHKLRKLSGDIYSDSKKLQQLFDLMKKEHLSPEQISTAIDNYLKELPLNEKYTYKRNSKNNKKGDLKQAEIDAEKNRMESTRAAAFLIDDYRRLMKQAGRYDFTDMILWVLEAFQQEPFLLQSYQERYQFILVDEFQDTNGSQNELLQMLASYWENPNIFVVGDDDQGIYEFQGARIRNILDFYERYKEQIKVIVLPHNYRSSQAIIDKAMATIQHNEQRLINQLTGLDLDKNIKAAHDRFKKPENNITPTVCIYNNVLQEEADILRQLDELQQKEVPLKEVAVIYAQHKQAENIMSLLEKKGIPYNAKKTVNILRLPLIEQLLRILQYLESEHTKVFSGEAELFEMLHSPFFGILPTDIAQLALYIQHSKKEEREVKWKLLLSDAELLKTLNLESTDAIIRLGKCLNEWERQLSDLPLLLLLEKIIYEGGVATYLMQTADHIWSLQVLHTFFDFAKEANDRDSKLKLSEFLHQIERMNDEDIIIAAQKVIQNENGVYFYTAHSAKGNEFEYVFLIGCTKKFWEEKKANYNVFKLPENITETKEDTEMTYKTEVSRRLFYVAITRAKKHLNISYSLNDNNGKGQFCSVFVDEISAMEDRQVVHVSAETILEQLKISFKPVPEVRIKIANGAWIDKSLQQFALSYSSLSKFLNCPLSFYYEVLLKVPFQKSDALAFGNAIHKALERWFLDMKARGGTFSDKDFLISCFDKALRHESTVFTYAQYERRLEQGHTLLSEYFDYYIDKLYKEVEIEFNVPKYILNGVPITGKIDKLEFIDDISCRVIDYKTGDPDKSSTHNLTQPNEKEPDGGDYWRQMVFYKILIDNYKDKHWRFSTGMFDYIQKSKSGEYKQVTVPVFKQDEERVLEQIQITYNKIINHEFETGCGKEECRWCNFTRRYELVRPKNEEYLEIDDV